jgi:pimeloyl-ACP methyl ester carboxylesterase
MRLGLRVLRVLVCLASCAVAMFAQAGDARASAADGGGFTVAANLRSGAFQVSGAPNVIVHAPAGFDAHKPLDLVVFLHGYSGCVSVLMGQGESRCRAGDAAREGWDLAAHHDAAGKNTLFIVPQLAFMQRDGRAGAFAKPLGFQSFLRELLGQTLASDLGGARSLQDVSSITLVAHSAGFTTALAILEHGGVSDRVKAVVLLDALYGGTAGYARYARAHVPDGLRFISLHLGQGDTHRENRSLYKRLRRSLGQERVVKSTDAELAEKVASHAVVIGLGRLPHAQMPQNHLATILRALPLPAR